MSHEHGGAAPSQSADEITASATPSAHAARVPSGSLLGLALASLGVALIGSLALGVLETTAVSFKITHQLIDEAIPTDLLIAAVGRIAITHLIFGGPVLIVVSVIYHLLSPRNTVARAVPALTALYVALAGTVVIPADLGLANIENWAVSIGGIAVNAVLAVALYFLLRLLQGLIGERRFGSVFVGVSVVCVLLQGVVVIAFVRSPLFDPGNYVAPKPTAAQTDNARPNVLWIVMDTTGVGHMSCYGYAKPTTPFLDEWSSQALVFDHAVSNGMWTLPVHASMFTGLSLREHGTDHNNRHLDDRFVTVAEILAKQGYATAVFTANPLLSLQTNLTQGFQTHRTVYHLRHLSDFSIGYLFERLGITPWFSWLDKDYGGAMINCLVSRWLDTQPEAPKFVFVNYMEQHLPYLAPRNYRERFMDPAQVHRSYDLRRRAYGRIVRRLDMGYNIDDNRFLSAFDREVLQRQYDAGIRYSDERVRELIGMFEQLDLLENTLVVICSDHGEHLGSHENWGHRFFTYQDLVHVAIMLRESGLSQAQRIATPVQLSDLYPTILHRALPNAGVIPLANARDLLSPDRVTDDPRIVISEFNGPAKETLKRINRSKRANIDHLKSKQIAAVGERYKLMRATDGQRELYDLREDPGELHNLIDQLPDEAKRLDAYIEAWLEHTPEYVPSSDVTNETSEKLLETLRSLGYVGEEEPNQQ